jgi:ribonuclease HI
LIDKQNFAWIEYISRMLLTIYTDGSCVPNPGPGGWAFVVYEEGREIYSQIGADSHTTNNRMEMRALLEAQLWLAGRPAMILSDSQYVINGVNMWSPGWRRQGWQRKDKKKNLVPVINSDLWIAIDAAKRPGQRYVWVRGHNGTRGNERADELAGDARLAGLHRQQGITA